jgi:hypothetical protein
MSIGIGTQIYDLANLPGQGGGGGGPALPTVDLIDNTYSFRTDASALAHMVVPDFTTAFTSAASVTNSFSISVWVQTTNIGVNYYPVGSGTNANGPFTGQASGSNARFSMRDSASTLYTLTTADAPISTNTFFYIAYVWDGTASSTERMKIYINGAQNTSSSIAGPSSLQTSGTSFNSNLLIGAYRSVPVTQGADLYLDEIALFTRALSDDDIKLIYDSTNDNSGKTAKLDTLSTGAPYAWYRMGD